MFLWFIIITAIVVCIEYYICKFILWMIGNAITLSKITFSLFVALVCNSRCEIVQGGGFASYAAWAAIILGICFVLCLSPRINCAFRFFCTSATSYLLVEMTLAFFGTIIMTCFGKEFQLTLFSEIIVKLVCLGFSGKALKETIQESDTMVLFQNPVFQNVERVLASILYGFACWIIFALNVNGLWAIPVWLEWVILLGSGALTFVMDYFFLDKICDGIRGYGLLANTRTKDEDF